MGTLVAGGGRSKPSVNFNFRISSLGGHFPEGGLGAESVEGLELGETDVIEYSEGNDDEELQLPGRTKYKNNIKIVRARDADDSMQRWRESVIEFRNRQPSGPLPESIYDTVIIDKYDRDNKTVLEQWFIDFTWPRKWSVDQLTRKGQGDVHRETLELVPGRVRCVKKAVPATISTLPAQ